ncbi:MAG: N-6 DNA methylase, partial [Candidatus Riflebacteria bacterium]
MLQESYFHLTSDNHRKKFSQFFTPDLIADLMAEWVLRKEPASVLDPAFGLGAFHQAIRRKKSQSKIFAYEIDPHILSFLPSSLSNDCLTTIKCLDFLESPCQKFSAIICNPPYSRFQNLKNRLKILLRLRMLTGEKFSSHTNLASLFLLKSLKQLKKNGRLAFIMPYEFINTGYGKKVKQNLISKRILKKILILENEKEIFWDALTTVCVLLCENSGFPEDLHFYRLKSSGILKAVNSFDDLDWEKIDYRKLDPAKKWSPILSGFAESFPVPEGFEPISIYGAFKRGIATGANSYFTFSLKKIKEWRIPESSLKPCITRSSQIKRPIFDYQELQTLIEKNASIFCLDAKFKQDAATMDYILHGEKIGINRKYLTRTRTPWFKTEARNPAPILFGVFCRSHFKVIRNYTECLNLTCYHSFYPNETGDRYIDHLFLFLLSDLGNNVLKRNQRIYGAGLIK